MEKPFKKAVGELAALPYMPDKGRIRTTEIARALAALGGPQLEYSRAQVIGTNGKGAAAFFLARLLSAHGLKTGLYTSPHLVSIRERIAFDGKLISEEDFAGLYFRLKPVFKKFRLTQFERLTVMAAGYFSQNKADFAVLETGIGGGDDAVTALCAPLLIYTAISPEHEDILGHGLRRIAAAKAAPLANCRFAFSAPQPRRGAADILRAAAKNSGAKLVFSRHPRRVRMTARGTGFEYRGYNYQVPLFGKECALNAALALDAARHILGARFHPGKARAALSGAVWPGRLQIIRLKNCNPLLVSCAHNAASLDADIAVIKTLLKKRIIPRDNLRVLFGVSGGRDSRAFLKKVSAVFKNVTVTKVPGSDCAFEKLRAAKGAEIIEDCREASRRIVGPRPAEKCFAVIIGSIYLAGAVLESAGVSVIHGR